MQILEAPRANVMNGSSLDGDNVDGTIGKGGTKAVAESLQGPRQPQSPVYILCGSGSNHACRRCRGGYRGGVGGGLGAMVAGGSQ